MGVPILRIPIVALTVLLGHLNNVQLVTMSLLSKRADWFLKTCGKRNVSFFNLNGPEIRDISNINILELFLLETNRQREIPQWGFKLCCKVPNFLLSINCLYFNIPMHFETLRGVENFVGDRRNLKFGGSVIPVVTTKENDGAEMIRTFWKNATNGMIALLDYFKSNFNLSIGELVLTGKNTRVMKTLVNHIYSTNILVRNVKVAFNVTETGFKFILENVSATETFFSLFPPSQNFKFDGAIQAKNITIFSSRFYDLKNILISIESANIDVRGSGFDEEECRTLIREWISGKLPKLKAVRLTTKNSYPNVTEGFPKRLDKSVTRGAFQSIAIRGPGDSYGSVSCSEMEQGYFDMCVHKH